MLDNYNGIAGISEPVEYAYELIYVVAVKPRRRLVQNVKRFTRGTFGKLGCKLNSLRFAARKRGCGLTEFNISERFSPLPTTRKKEDIRREDFRST